MQEAWGMRETHLEGTSITRRAPRARRPSGARRYASLLAFALLAAALGPVGSSAPPVAIAAEGNVTIEVRDRETGDPVTDFRFLVNENNARDTASTTNPASYSPIAAWGTVTPEDPGAATITLPDGRYLVTVLAGPFPGPGEALRSDYKMWGAHFTVAGVDQTVTVDLVPNPLPLARLRVRAFEDVIPVNGELDIPVERGLEGLHVVISDPVGEVTVDWFGNPLCGGQCLTNANGNLVIENLPPGKYEVDVIPPDGSGWVQTTTIEGTHTIDAWLTEGFDGYSPEEGFALPAVWVGFVKECRFAGGGCPTDLASDAGGATIIGRVRGLGIDIEAPGDQPFPGTFGAPVRRPYLALNNIGGNDEQVWTGRGNTDGTFEIPEVPPGTYQIAYWDEPLDYIIQFRTVQVTEADRGRVVDVGDLGIPRWFGTIKGYAYVDNGIAANGDSLDPDLGTPENEAAGNGLRDCAEGHGPDDVAYCEKGIRGQDLDIRHKDGSVQYATVTDGNGRYVFPEYFEWEHYLLWEVGFGRHAQVTTAAYKTDFQGEPIGYPDEPVNGDVGLGALLQAQLTWANSTLWVDTGKLPYGGGANGGITGIVFYATTRNEFDPSLAAAEDYEPGVPGATVNLYEAVLDEDGEPVVMPDGSLAKGDADESDTDVDPLQTVETDSWTHPTDCSVGEYLGQPPFTDPECLELPRTFNQVQNGVFDGGYAFEDLPAGTYIVEALPPPGYRVIREEDQNTDQGDDFVPAVPPPPCAGALHVVNDPRNPADGTSQPLCDAKLVTLEEGFNAAADFFVMTENGVPPAGRIRGVLLDDLTIQFDPASILYGEKRGLPNAPVGILDFAGNELATVYTDEDGYFEVLVPSSYTALCPVPAGVCPGMYQVIGNYPGNSTEPDPRWNPNYAALNLAFDVWPGKTTYADVATIPITGFVASPDSLFANPPVCAPQAGTPDVRRVSRPLGPRGVRFTIRGTGFGAVQGIGSVTLDGMPITVVSWSGSAITVEVPAGFATGPHQLLVTRSNGRTSPTGVTFHVLGPGYSPPRLHVGAGFTYPTIEEALDAAVDGDLIVVHPGTYSGAIIVPKNVKLQGYGPWATILDGRFFTFGRPEEEAELTWGEFEAKVAATPYDGPDQVPMGQVVTVLATDGQFGSSFRTQIDGFAIRFGQRLTQGGGVYLHAYARHTVISNNLIQSNAGALGGGVILGQPYAANPDAGGALDNENDDVSIHHNRILNNGGFSLAGGVALFNGAEGYDIGRNVICGNYSGEYGGGISHFGMSPGGRIHDNQILFNYGFDEGGGVMIAGEQPFDAAALSDGSGDVAIERNRIQGNVSNDDGGGIRLLQPVEGPISIVNNMVVNNVATDFGGGISLDDALDVRIVNNTIARNISTATAEDADRSPACRPADLGSCPHAAGLSSEPHSAALMATSPSTTFSDPVLFNNIFWRNEAFYLTGDGADPLASAGSIDLEVVGTAACFSPAYSIFTLGAYPMGADPAGCNVPDPTDTPPGTNRVGTDPLFVQAITTDFVAVAFLGDPAFITVVIRTGPTDPQGNYHIRSGSPAIGTGAGSYGGVAAPADDFDGDPRPQPSGGAFDIGADERRTS